ncbi:unnamed protein product [Somion occarium]|uniref:Uncharacterized protein n=1 Tax=Somion occarium TaxID=3059160 RepID=A0ABP1DBR4_9APHY
MLARSKQVPLMVKPSEFQEQNEDTLKLVLNELHRIQHLELVCSHRVERSIAHEFSTPISAPMLEFLGLSPPSEQAILDTPNERIFPFFSHLPRLSALVTQGYSFAQVRKFFRPTLQILQLWEPPTAHQLLECLRSMPLLCKLDVMVLPEEESCTRMQAVPFARLQTLRLEGSASCLTFLRHIACPPGLQLSLTIQCHTFTSELVHDVLDLVAVHCDLATNSRSGQEVCSISLEHRSSLPTFPIPSTMMMKCWTSVIPHDVYYIRDSPKPILELEIECETPFKVADACEACVRDLRTSSVKVLWVALDKEPENQFKDLIHDFSRTFRPMENVDTFLAEAWPTPWLAAFLTSQTVLPEFGGMNKESDQSQHSIVFPNLKVLTAPYLTWPMNQSSTYLSDALEFRKSCGAPIDELDLLEVIAFDILASKCLRNLLPTLHREECMFVVIVVMDLRY